MTHVLHEPTQSCAWVPPGCDGGGGEGKGREGGGKGGGGDVQVRQPLHPIRYCDTNIRFYAYNLTADLKCHVRKGDFFCAYICSGFGMYGLWTGNGGETIGNGFMGRIL